MEQVLITRSTRGETVGGKERAPRVYITGPHFETSVYSSTEDRAEASTFDRPEAERLLAFGHWRHLDPQIEAL